jgi:hypothetical protein
MTELAIFEIFIVLLAIPFSYFLAMVVKKSSASGYKNDIDSDFLREWNGKPEDEYYAWLRLRKRYRNQDSPPNHFRHIEEKINQVNKMAHLSTMGVTEKGELISYRKLDNSSSKKTGYRGE